MQSTHILNLGLPGEMKTVKEWDAIYSSVDGYRIIDPDGFDRSDPLFHTRTYTEEDFVRRRTQCTMVPKGWLDQ